MILVTKMQVSTNTISITAALHIMKRIILSQRYVRLQLIAQLITLLIRQLHHMYSAVKNNVTVTLVETIENSTRAHIALTHYGV